MAEQTSESKEREGVQPAHVLQASILLYLHAVPHIPAGKLSVDIKLCFMPQNRSTRAAFSVTACISVIVASDLLFLISD